MASYQARQRDPLLDQNIQAALERRGKELLGVALLALGLLTAMMLASYSPDDPSWLAATDEPARNLLGRFGAALASPLFVIAGHGAWMIAVIFAAWGARFLTHRGEDRALGRVIFAPAPGEAGTPYTSFTFAAAVPPSQPDGVADVQVLPSRMNTVGVVDSGTHQPLGPVVTAETRTRHVRPRAPTLDV